MGTICLLPARTVKGPTLTCRAASPGAAPEADWRKGVGGLVLASPVPLRMLCWLAAIMAVTGSWNARASQGATSDWTYWPGGPIRPGSGISTGSVQLGWGFLLMCVFDTGSAAWPAKGGPSGGRRWKATGVASGLNPGGWLVV